MICIIDFDGTLMKNDFFKEGFFKLLIEKPHLLVKHFFFQRKSLLDLKYTILSKLDICYPIDHLFNPLVIEWIKCNKSRFSKMIVVSASPDFFIKNQLSKITFFDELYGSTELNLKGINKLNFIIEKFGHEFAYVGDSNDDILIFNKAKIALKLTSKGLINVKD